MEWTWAGHHWYARDFSVRIRSNSSGFRDTERSIDPDPGVTRIALLGDSVVEALQVPFERTAAQLLKQWLNTHAGRRAWEVLNFGVSNYGVGQYLLVWEHYAQRYRPRYVLALVCNYLFRRTVMSHETAVLSDCAPMRVRPLFRIENGQLMREPPADFEAFVATQERLIKNQFGGSRIMRRKRQLFTPERLREGLHGVVERLMALQRRFRPLPQGAVQESSPPCDPETIQVKRLVLQELGRQVASQGA